MMFQVSMHVCSSALHVEEPRREEPIYSVFVEVLDEVAHRILSPLSFLRGSLRQAYVREEVLLLLASCRVVCGEGYFVDCLWRGERNSSVPIARSCLLGGREGNLKSTRIACRECTLSPCFD